MDEEMFYFFQSKNLLKSALFFVPAWTVVGCRDINENYI